MPPFPVARYLVPARTNEVPESFTVLESSLGGGLPHKVDLSSGLSLSIALATGLADAFRRLPLDTVVSSSEPELAPFAELDDWASVDPVARCSLLIAVREQGAVVGTWPLVAGVTRVLGSAVPLELVVVGWTLRAGNIVGSGEFGSWLALAYRRLDRGIARFSQPPPHPHVLPKLVREDRYTASELGVGYQRGRTKRVAPRAGGRS
ncbi:MAG TPA: hypothetical protein VGK73_33210 [Polyangiaceae bacterium]